MLQAIVSKNNVEGAGVVQILVGSSDSDTSFTDRVTVKNANLSTENGDISLAATSDIDHDLEAESVDDQGKGLKFNVFCYNVQPGVEIDYQTGENWLAEQ